MIVFIRLLDIFIPPAAEHLPIKAALSSRIIPEHHLLLSSLQTDIRITTKHYNVLLLCFDYMYISTHAWSRRRLHCKSVRSPTEKTHLSGKLLKTPVCELSDIQLHTSFYHLGRSAFLGLLSNSLIAFFQQLWLILPQQLRQVGFTLAE